MLSNFFFEFRHYQVSLPLLQEKVMAVMMSKANFHFS